VRPHGLARRLGVVALDGREDLLVMELAALGSAGYPEDARALFAEQPHDRVDERRDERVLGRLGEREMEVEVGLD